MESTSGAGDPGKIERILEELSSIREEMNKRSIQLEYSQQYQKVLLDIAETKHDVERKWNYVRIGGAIISIFVATLGTIGIHSFSDTERRAEQGFQKTFKKMNEEMNSDLAARREFYGNLMAGTALTVLKNYTAAMPKLKRCFDEEHTYDKSVLIPLLVSINLTDDWLEAEPVLKRLRSDQRKFDQINDPTVYRIVGAIEVQSGLSLRIAGNASEGTSRMDRGFTVLKQAFSIAAPNDYETRRHILYNFWIYHIGNGQFREAQEDAAAVDRLPPGVKVYSWSHMRTWRCIKDLAGSSDPRLVQKVRIAEQQWKKLASRYIADGAGLP